MTADKPDYSPFARQYAQSRPGYPLELYSYLASLTNRQDHAWDCATGNGQAAVQLVKYFARVTATDISPEQIKHAAQHPQIQYRVAEAEQSGLSENSVDAVTVASAAHWFHQKRFGKEVQRVMRPNGILAVWAYHVGHMEPPFDQLFHHFYYNILYDYFASGARLVDDHYKNLVLPGKPEIAENFHVSADWNMDQMIGFIQSWSGTQMFLQEQKKNPTTLILRELEQLWGPPEKIHALRWPLYLRISRI